MIDSRFNFSILPICEGGFEFNELRAYEDPQGEVDYDDMFRIIRDRALYENFQGNHFRALVFRAGQEKPRHYMTFGPVE
jgi:hypothetical protein